MTRPQEQKGLFSFNSFSSYHRDTPLGPTPSQGVYYGLAGQIVKAIEPHTEADPIAILIQLLTAFGNIVGRGPYFSVEADRHYPNLFAVIVGQTSRGRKGTSWGYCRRIFAGIAEDWVSAHIASGLSTGEGLIMAVCAELPDKRLLVVEEEFASALKVAGRAQNILSPILRQAWDSTTLSVLNKNSPLRATEAHISVIGHVTQGELQRCLSSTDIANGFANRFLWICSRRSKPLPDGGNLSWDELNGLIAQLGDAVGHARQLQEVKRDGEARDLWHSVYEKLSTESSGIVEAVTSRAEAQTIRLALIYALLDRSTEIKRVHLEAALALWRYCEASARYIFGEGLGSPDAETVLRHLRAIPEGLSRTDIMTSIFKNNRRAAEIDAALQLLLESSLARCEMKNDTNGRPEERWFAVEEQVLM
jgi:hypothetical protein